MVPAALFDFSKLFCTVSGVFVASVSPYLCSKDGVMNCTCNVGENDISHVHSSQTVVTL